MNLLYLTCVFPLVGFLLLVMSRGRFSENIVATIGAGSIGLSALVTAWVGIDFTLHPPEGGVYHQVLWSWLVIADFRPQFALYLDGLSLTMLSVVTGVGFLIHVFASWYMRGEEDYARFFCFMNLFVMSMLFLVLGDSFTFLYFGWEGVGLCSYLLIGFYYKNPANGAAAMKAFIITRIGDVFMAIGLFLLFDQLGTLNIQEAMARAHEQWPIVNGTANPLAMLAALMLLGGAVGKSAQLPLQTWLPDAMAGPTPVSALIHAATMVTAGVYLIARTHVLFELAPSVQNLVGVIGAVTLLLAGFTALVQTDIKKILAYSTMSQIGYMFLALGAGAWSAAIFHLMTHAFFKALLFLSAGAVIIACHHEQDIFKMGGLRKKIPLVFWCFIIGGGALTAFPLLTAGYFSKDEILWLAFANGHINLFYAGLVGAFLTSLYTFRLIFVVFFGEEKTHAHEIHGITYWLPLSILLALSTTIGGYFIHLPLHDVLPNVEINQPEGMEHKIAYLSAGVALSGILVSWLLFGGKRTAVTSLANSSVGRLCNRLWFNAWGFDWIYNLLFVRTYLLLVHLNRRDRIDSLIGLIPRMMRFGHDVVSLTQNGKLRFYVLSVALGAVLILVAAVFL